MWDELPVGYGGSRQVKPLGAGPQGSSRTGAAADGAAGAVGPGIREGVNRANLQANNPENEVEDGWREFWLEHFNLEEERRHLGLCYHWSLPGLSVRRSCPNLLFVTETGRARRSVTEIGTRSEKANAETKRNDFWCLSATGKLPKTVCRSLVHSLCQQPLSISPAGTCSWRTLGDIPLEHR